MLHDKLKACPPKSRKYLKDEYRMLTLRIPEQLYAAMQRDAKSKKVSMNWLGRSLIEEYLEQRK